MAKRVLLLMIYYFLLCMLFANNIHARSPYRQPDQLDPVVTVCSSDSESMCYTFCESHLHEIIFKLYDESFFYAHLLPTTLIPYRYEPQKMISGYLLSQLIQEAVDTIKNNKYGRHLRFTHFHILKMRDINSAGTAGLFILKFKDFPFVVKLFIETPDGLFRPGDKGFEPLCFYYMSGGVSRHLSGFTRIKNMYDVALLTQHHSRWGSRLSFPRKWFWLPKNPSWLTITGNRIGPQTSITTRIPAVYAIVCDQIIWKRPFIMSNSSDRTEAIELSNFLNHRIDLHINNFGIEQQSGKLVLIDFEHFPSFVGLRQRSRCNSYFQWFSRLASKMIQDTLLRNKQERRVLQFSPYQPDKIPFEPTITS